MHIQLKISIDEIKPPIWRRVIVKDALTFQQLHNVIQIALGWTGSHLYSFEIQGYTIEFDPLVDNNGVNELNVLNTQLKDLPLNEKLKFKYVYDFGDNWEHTIVIEKLVNLGPEFPVCLAGKRNAPPEDIGGPHMYQNIMKDLKSGKLAPDFRDWLGDYDAEYFDMEETNDILSDPDALNEDYLSHF